MLRDFRAERRNTFVTKKDRHVVQDLPSILNVLGRAAANSAVCYCLGVTAVDPTRVEMLFERFISKERDEPPDIDIDFEHERREEVIQHLYAKYGRDRAALTAEVISYRGKSAIRDVGKAMGLSLDVVGMLAKDLDWWSDTPGDPARLRAMGLKPDDPHLSLVIRLARELTGFPRHLSQHVGGFVITRTPLSELVPVENAAMIDRTVIEWDKDDIEAMGMLKVDVLGLGMLSCIRKAFELVRTSDGEPLTLATVPPEDPATYDMICDADTVGVFQIESRAQMSMLPRLRPQCYYDLVIEVAIVRPGPIQGQMVHPYLKRRSGMEPVRFASPEIERVLARTMGVPLFQEQAMAMAVVAAGFTPVRQRPGTASGIVFFTIEDETGIANLIVRPRIYERFRRVARHSPVIAATGTVERAGKVVHVLVRSIREVKMAEGAAFDGSRDFH